MSRGARDPIAFVEACYDLSASDEQWLQRVAELARPLMKAEALIAYHLEIDAQGILVGKPVQSGDAHGDVAERLAAQGELFARERNGHGRLGMFERLKLQVLDRSFRALLEESVDRMLLSERKTYGPRWAYTLGVPEVRELLFLINHHIDGHGATFLVGSLAESGRLRPAERAMLQRLGAHLKAGFRLRRRLPEHLRAVQAGEDGAVLDSSARLVHAQGDARDGDARAALEHRAREIDLARTKRGGRDEQALQVWQGLVDGRWSLVERFDVDGKRFMLAHKNPEDVVDPRGLTPLEARISALAVRGYSDKLIAYHLGIAEGTVSSQLARAMRKLGFAGRVELVRTLGKFEPPRRTADEDET